MARVISQGDGKCASSTLQSVLCKIEYILGFVYNLNRHRGWVGLQILNLKGMDVHSNGKNKGRLRDMSAKCHVRISDVQSLPSAFAGDL